MSQGAQMLELSPWDARQIPGICYCLLGIPLRGPGEHLSRAESPLGPWDPWTAAPGAAALLPPLLLLPVRHNLGV